MVNNIIKPLVVAFQEDERKEILADIDRCLKSGQLFQGKYVGEFERCFAEIHKSKHAVAVSSGTVAIEMAMRILGVKNGQEVLVPTNTFIATALGVIHAGGRVRLVDNGKGKMMPTLDELQKRLTKNTVGLVMVHIGGMISPEIEEIRPWCEKNGIWLFEDAAHAHGSSYKGVYAGNFGIAGGFSLFATKVITCGEGGVILTNDGEFAQHARMIRNFGKSDAWLTKNNVVGYNYRMSEITAVIALSQTKRLEMIKEERKKIAMLYQQLFRERLPWLDVMIPESDCSWYKFMVMLPKNVSTKDITVQLHEKGVNLPGPVYEIPLHRQPIAQELGFTGEYPHADHVCSHHICLPIYPSLNQNEVQIVVDALTSVIKV